MPHIFITRELGSASPLRLRLEAAGHSVSGFSLVAFRATGGWSLGQLPTLDWIFFYSSRGTAFFAEGLDGSLPEGVRLAAIGPGTAAAVEEHLGRRPDFVGNGRPADTARAFEAAAAGCRVLFPRARQSEESIRKLLGSAIDSVDLIVYENHPIGPFACPEADLLVFTSPLNARAYYDQCPARGEKLLAIGETTAAKLRELGRAEVQVPERPDEASIADFCLKEL